MPMVIKVQEGGCLKIGEDIVIAYVRRSAGVLRLEVQAPPTVSIVNEPRRAPGETPHDVVRRG